CWARVEVEVASYLAASAKRGVQRPARVVARQGKLGVVVGVRGVPRDHNLAVRLQRHGLRLVSEGAKMSRDLAAGAERGVQVAMDVVTHHGKVAGEGPCDEELPVRLDGD